MANTLRIFLLGLAVCLILATALPLWRHDAWWVRACEFPRVQITVAGLLVIAGLAWVGRTHAVERGILIALILCLSFQVYRIYPYTLLAPRQVFATPESDPGAGISILVSNVLMDNREADRLLAQIARWQPDLVLFLEIDRWWHEQLGVLSDEYPSSLARPLDNTYGIGLYSRLPLVDPRIEELIEPEVPSIHAQIELDSGRTVDLHCLHPKPPYPAESLETTERDGELLLVGREIGKHSRPAIVAGDLNDVAWSYTTRLLQRISGLLDPRRGRGFFSTYHASLPVLRWPLDHVFHSQHFKLVEIARLPHIGSDHFPIFVRLSLEPEAPLQQEPLEPQPGDRQEAAEKIEAAEPLVDVDDLGEEGPESLDGPR